MLEKFGSNFSVHKEFKYPLQIRTVRRENLITWFNILKLRFLNITFSCLFGDAICSMLQSVCLHLNRNVLTYFLESLYEASWS